MPDNRFVRLWRRYGPTFRWQMFRLHGEPPNGTWMPLRVTQIIGGRSWSLALTRLGAPTQTGEADCG